MKKRDDFPDVAIDLGCGIPSFLRLVPVDFEAGVAWWELLVESGFDSEREQTATLLENQSETKDPTRGLPVLGTPMKSIELERRQTR